MADDKIMEMVRAELASNPAISTAELFESAKKKHKKQLGDMTIRRFHALYPLQIKRKAAAARPRRRVKKRKGSNVDREAIKKALLGFAAALMSAEGAELVGVIGSMDKVVEQVVAATGKA